MSAATARGEMLAKAPGGIDRVSPPNPASAWASKPGPMTDEIGSAREATASGEASPQARPKAASRRSQTSTAAGAGRARAAASLRGRPRNPMP